MNMDILRGPLLFIFSAKYAVNRFYQIDMKFPVSKSNAGKSNKEAPVRDRSSLWPGGVIPYTVTYNIRKFLK